jgi:hypothetical protein
MPGERFGTHVGDRHPDLVPFEVAGAVEDELASCPKHAAPWVAPTTTGLGSFRKPAHPSAASIARPDE